MNRALGLRAGDWITVRSAAEILATLDERGRLDALPFMPEMLQYCGKSFRVYKSAHKACDTLATYKNRHMSDAVHLEGLRCDGSAHAGCQAGCLLFWKEAWLERASDPQATEPPKAEATTRPSTGSAGGVCDVAALTRATRMPAAAERDGKERYRCQATDMLEATTPLGRWDFGHYLKDLRSRNVRVRDFLLHASVRALIAAFQSVARWHRLGRRAPQYPMVCGLAGEKTPVEVLNLKAGELVRVRSKAEIMRTINAQQKNRGLFFDEEMLPFCGKNYRVLRRVERIIDERTGELINIGGACIILDGVVCSGNRSSNRLFCPRAIYPYWREIWLKRVEER